MNIEVAKVRFEEKSILDNLLKMYCYEWSQYNMFDVNQLGEYEFEYHINDYLGKDNYYSFFVKVDGKLAGFVFIDDDCTFNSDYAIAEFFIMYKYRRAGVGRYVANTMFDMFHGKWEVGRHPHNINSMKFWDSVIAEYTNGKYKIATSCQDAVYHDGTSADIILFEN